MSLFNTRLQDMRAAYPNMLDRDELRLIQFGLVSSAFDHTNSPMSIVTPEVRALAMKSVGRLLDIPVIVKGGVTISNTRSCTITPYENTSEMVSVVWTTLAANISMIPSQYATNEIGYTADFAQKVVLVKEGFLDAMEDAIYAALDANKSTVFASTLVGVGNKYPLVADTLQVSLANQQLFFNDIKAIQAAGEFRPMQHYIDGSINLMPTVEFYLNQGAGNQTNTNFQMADKVFRFSNGVPDGPGVRATGFFMPHGSIGVLTRVDQDSLNNSKAGDGTEWSTTVIDGMPFQIGVQYKSRCADQSGIVGLEHLKATLLDLWQLSFDFAILTPFNSDPATLEGSIKKFEFLPA